MTKRAKLTYFNVEELAAHILGVTEQYEESDEPSYLIEDVLYEELGINFDTFHEIVSLLVPLITVAESPLTKKLYKGFGADGVWLVKEEVV